METRAHAAAQAAIRSTNSPAANKTRSASGVHRQMSASLKAHRVTLRAPRPLRRAADSVRPALGAAVPVSRNPRALARASIRPLIATGLNTACGAVRVRPSAPAPLLVRTQSL